MLRYENMGTICIKIDLHNRNYSVVAIAKWNKETEKYMTTHLSEDQVMQNAFLNHVDIHATTASEVFDVPIDQ